MSNLESNAVKGETVAMLKDHICIWTYERLPKRLGQIVRGVLQIVLFRFMNGDSNLRKLVAELIETGDMVNMGVREHNTFWL